MEKKEATSATLLNAVDNNTKLLGLSGTELVQLPFSAFPEATENEKGLMSGNDKRSNPSSSSLRRYILTPNVGSRKACRIIFDAAPINGSVSIKLYGTWNNGISMGCIRKVIGFHLSSLKVLTIYDSSVYECSATTCAQFYITDAFVNDGKACIDIINKNSMGENNFLAIVESYAYSLSTLVNQNPLSENLTKNNRDETAYVLK